MMMSIVSQWSLFFRAGVAGLFLFFLYGKAGAFSFPEKSSAFLEHQSQTRQFEAQRARFLQERLRQKALSSSVEQKKEEHQAFLKHQAKQNQFEQRRGAAFLEYKKQKAMYEKQKKAILRTRLSRRSTPK